MTIIITYSQYRQIEEIIKSNDPLDSYRKGYLQFLDSVDKSLTPILSSVVDIDLNMEIECEFDDELKSFLYNKLSEDSTYKLICKLLDKSE